MSISACLRTALRHGVLTKDEFEALMERWLEISRDTLDTAEARAKMQRELEAEAAHRERAALLTQIRFDQVMEDLRNYRTGNGRVDMAEAWIAMHENFGRNGTFLQDVEGRREAIARGAQSDLRQAMAELSRGAIMGDLSRTARRGGSRKKQARMRNMVAELFGESTGDVTAAALARAWEETSEKLRIRFNAAGGAIQKLQRWGMPQSHDALALFDYGRDAWVKYMLEPGVLDRDRIVNSVTGDKLTDRELRRALQDIWLKITTDGWSDRDVTAKPPQIRPALYRQHLDHRFLHFKSAEAWLAYQDKFGSRDVFATMMGHIAVMARDIAHMEIFGPSPNAFRQLVGANLTKMAALQRPHDLINSEIRALMTDLQQGMSARASASAAADFARLAQALDDFETAIDKAAAEANVDAALAAVRLHWQPTPDLVPLGRELDKLWAERKDPVRVADGQERPVDYVRRRLDRADTYWQAMRGMEPGNRHGAEIMQSIRNFLSATMLGGAWLSSLSDPAFGAEARRRFGMSFARAFGPSSNVGRVMAATMKEMVGQGTRQDAIDAMLGVDAALNILRRKATEVRGIDHRFWSGWIADRTLTWTMLSPWTQAGKHMIGMDIMRFLGQQVGSRFEDLPARTQAALTSHGIDAQTWESIRTAPLHEGRLRPNEIIAQVGRELGERYLQMILRETRYAVPEATVASRTLVTGIGKPGTILGEMARSSAQFKGFGVAVVMLWAGNLARDIYNAQGSAKFTAAGQVVPLVITSTILGALAMALKDVRDGRDPRKWLDEDTWLDWKHWGAAFMQAGGLGIYGDFLFSESNRFGGGLSSTVAGPLVGRASDVLSVMAEVNAAISGKPTHFGRWATNIARGNVPFTNLWMWSLIYQRVVMDELQRMVDPEADAAFARKVRKRQRNYGQRHWWPAGYSTPQSVPDLGRVLSTE